MQQPAYRSSPHDVPLRVATNRDCGVVQPTVHRYQQRLLMIATSQAASLVLKSHEKKQHLIWGTTSYMGASLKKRGPQSYGWFIPKNDYHGMIWGVLKMGIPPNHQILIFFY